MIIAFDTYYFDTFAKTVCLTFNYWNDSDYTNVYTETLENITEYIPGEFYRKELPCILSLTKKINLQNVNFIIIDGFVYLDDNKKFGLGAFLYESLNRKIPIIGIAKTNFATIEKNKKTLIRGKSKNPLFITSIGIEVEEALKKVETMHGEYRIPTLLKELDRLTREK